MGALNVDRDSRRPALREEVGNATAEFGQRAVRRARPFREQEDVPTLGKQPTSSRQTESAAAVLWRTREGERAQEEGNRRAAPATAVEVIGRRGYGSPLAEVGWQGREDGRRVQVTAVVRYEDERSVNRVEPGCSHGAERCTDEVKRGYE